MRNARRTNDGSRHPYDSRHDRRIRVHLVEAHSTGSTESGTINAPRTTTRPESPSAARCARDRGSSVSYASTVSAVSSPPASNATSAACSNAPRNWMGPVHKLVFHHLLDKPPQAPDFFLFAVTSRSAGLLSIESEHWKSDGVVLFALSQSKESQEAILLMPGHSWFRGGLGTFIADPDRDQAVACHAASSRMTTPCDSQKAPSKSVPARTCSCCVRLFTRNSSRTINCSSS